MADGLEEMHFLRGIAARLRALAITEPMIGDQLRQLADEADDRADAMERPQRRPRP